MNKFLTVFILVLLTGNLTSAQNHYQVLVERPNEKSLKGIISREVLTADTSFHWYQQNEKGYVPNARAIAGLKNLADSIRLVVFMGTWCEDSQVIIPKLFALTDAAGFPEDRITLIGVDRKKETIGHLSGALEIKNVPTIIVFQNGREEGRVIEYGKTGMFDQDLAQILETLRRK